MIFIKIYIILVTIFNLLGSIIYFVDKIRNSYKWAKKDYKYKYLHYVLGLVLSIAVHLFVIWLFL